VGGVVQAIYSGDNNFKTSSSGPLAQTVLASPISLVSPSSEVQFTNQAVNTTSAPVPVTLTNIGTAPLKISSIKVAGTNLDDFNVTNNCPASLAAPPQPVTLPLAPPYSCTIYVSFRPDDVGTRTATMNITDNDASSSPQMVGLTGLSLSSIKSDFNRRSIASGKTIWFSSSFKVRGPIGKDVSPSLVQISVTNGTITFNNGSQPYTLQVPNALILLDPNATTSTTTWDTANNRWVTRVPSTDRHDHRKIFDVDGNSFLTGMGFQVPSGGLRGDIEPVTWSASFTTDTPGISIQWRWGAAVYTSFPASTDQTGVTTGDYNQLGIKAIDDAHFECSSFHNQDDAGTPENFKQYWVRGATGDDRDDFTGDNSRTVGVPPTVAPLSLSVTELNFGNVPAGSASAPMTVTLTNTGVNPVAISNILVGGTDANNFAFTNGCGATLNPQGSCSVSVVYTPEGEGTNTAVLSITSGNSQAVQTVELGGSGTP
jgi:hypothetical protein